MRLDARLTRVELAKRGMKQVDIVRKGIPLGTLNNAMQENRISSATAEKIASLIGTSVSKIEKKER